MQPIPPILPPLGGLSAEVFLRDYWQKKPLLIRQAFPGFVTPIEPEEFAGLACEDDVNARIVLETAGSRPWEARHGPFTEDDFRALPENGWSLLVTDVEKVIPEFMDIVERFRFVPDWRIDDLMISYAPPGGSVGAHVDQYDVFLLQGYGTRRWMIETAVREHEDLIPDIDLRILREFNPDESWVLEPGDMLYLPPGIPHHGVALEGCMTFSIGFRAPRHTDIVAGVCDYLATALDENRFYSDPDLVLADNPGRIGPQALSKLRAVVRDTLSLSDDQLDRLLCRVLTERRADMQPFYPQNEDLSPAALDKKLRKGERLMRTPACRLAFIDASDGTRVLFADGEELPLPPALHPLAAYLCGAVHYDPDTLCELANGEDGLSLLAQLYTQGALLDD